LKLWVKDIFFNVSSSTRESFPPETPTQIRSLFFIILYFEIVLAVFLRIDVEKQVEHRFSPEYFLE
jgi:hypothetical protein